MKSTPKVTEQTTANAENNNAQNSASGPKMGIQPGQIVNVGDLIRKTKEQNPEAIKEPTSYPAAPQIEPATKPEASTPETPKVETPAEPATQAQPAPQPAQTMALVKQRSRSEEIEYQIEKAKQTQLVNNQLQSLKTKLTELKQFSYTVDKDEDYGYARLVIYDDNNREFQCKNHGVVALVVEELKKRFSEKIEEKENELLTVSHS